MRNTRRTFALSLAVSMLALWLYFGLPPFGPGSVPMTEGTMGNFLAKIIIIPLTLAIVGIGGLAAADALGSAPDSAAARQSERRKLAHATPAGIAWIVFVAGTAYPLGPVGNAAAICASALAIVHILRNAVTLGVFRASDAPHDCPQGGA